jgi:hypothetical protein
MLPVRHAVSSHFPSLRTWNSGCGSEYHRSLNHSKGNREMAQVQLESDKYMKHVMRDEKARWRKARNEKAIADFTTFVLGLVAMGVGVYAVQNQEVWVPVVQRLLNSI